MCDSCELSGELDKEETMRIIPLEKTLLRRPVNESEAGSSRRQGKHSSQYGCSAHTVKCWAFTVTVSEMYAIMPITLLMINVTPCRYIVDFLFGAETSLQ